MCLVEPDQILGPGELKCFCHLEKKQCNVTDLTPEEEDQYLLKGKQLNKNIVKRKNSNEESFKGEDNDSKKVKLRREVDLIGAIFVIVGSQIGSGIFVSPKGKFFYTLCHM
jgi:hypothetical protein